MNGVVYKGVLLHKSSTAYELYQNWQSAKTDRNQHQKKLDVHMRMVDDNHKQLLERYK